MLDKPLDQITYADLDQFVKEQWPEGKSVDYKRDVYGNKDDDKKELLKDASSFANTEGGDILIGVDEDKGLPTGIPGVTVPDVDKEKLRLDEIIRRGLDPRIEFGIHHVTTPASTTVLIIRVKESLIFPHRVVFHGKFGEFWARHSSGKYSMDTLELRRAFNLSETIYEKIRGFRHDRVSAIVKHDTPIPLREGGKMVFHLIPVESFRARLLVDVTNLHSLSTQFPPLACGGWSRRINLDGHLNYGGSKQSEPSRSYTQVFRNGIVEAVMGDVTINVRDDQTLYFRAAKCEETLASASATYLKSLGELNVKPPIWCFLTFIGVKGAIMSTDHMHVEDVFPIDRDDLFLPEAIIEVQPLDTKELLRPLFDLVWNAGGLVRP